VKIGVKTDGTSVRKGIIVTAVNCSVQLAAQSSGMREK
jgi:hypothetical protein